MAKFHGKVGYVHTEETAPGVHTEVVVEKVHYGDILYNSRHWATSDNLNDNLVLSNRISIIGTDYAYENFQSIRYVEYMGANWKVNYIEVQRPRLILNLGDVYNGGS